MSDTSQSETLRRALFDALDDERTGMLGLEGSSDHSQPMTHFFDPDSRTLWFVTANDTDLAQQVSGGAKRASVR